MTAQRIGVLHPGEMGIAIAVTIKNSGHDVFWASEGRSARTRTRAESAGLVDAGTLAALCETCAVIVSVCPPEFAADVADAVLGCQFRGMYVDANAVSPASKLRVAERMEQHGVRFVDGGIIGLPARARGQTWLYLSGAEADSAACCFTAGPIEPEVIGTEIGKASALKMCFAAQSKGSTALLCAVLGAAQELGVLEQLKRQWARGGPVLAEVERNILRSAPKAWRYVGEMHEIAATLEAAGMPPQFHEGAARIYESLRQFRDGQPEFEEVLRELRKAYHA
jgi:3-hydroxyisobutyrate dehydrogenase-like beta-hydroxyacid dehydrogenase